MKKEKTYALSVEDYVVYEKIFYVDATSKKEAVKKFRNGEWTDSTDEGNYFNKSVVRAVKQFFTQESFADYLKANGWEMRKGRKYNPFVLHKDVPGFSGCLSWHIFENHAEQFIARPSGAELWGRFDYSDGLDSLKANSLRVPI